MNKQEILHKIPNSDDKILISKVLDKIKFSETRNQITNTNFVDSRQQHIITKILASIKYTNYICHGGVNNAERTQFIFFPNKFDINFIINNIDNNIKCIKLTLPKELHGAYSHRNYLGGIIKLGIEREKIGDILVNKSGANILVCSDIANSLADLLTTLTRFSKSQIEIISTKDLPHYETKKEETKIIVPSLRLDSVVSELAHTSRAKACEILASERVIVNYETETKISKMLKPSDIITIRGKGKFIISDIAGKTKSGNLIVIVHKYI